jgi:hypothetical protein
LEEAVVATVTELDAQIERAAHELEPLRAAADRAQERCLEQFAVALAPKIEETARWLVERQPTVTQRLAAAGSLGALKASVRALANDSRALVEECLKSDDVWAHLHPETTSFYSDYDFKMSGRAGRSDATTAELSFAWHKPLECVSKKFENLMAREGYERPSLYLRAAKWPLELWEALGTYAQSAGLVVTACQELKRLREERDRLAAANAWDSAG